MTFDRSRAALGVAFLCSAASANATNVAPTNDDCAIAQAIVGPGPFAFDTTTASTGATGQSEALCLYGGVTSIESDVWFYWTAASTGQFMLSFCGTAGFNTKVAIYDGFACPPPGAIACNDDACGVESALSFFGVAGQSFTIQVGVHPGTAAGMGSFAITSVPPCPPSGSSTVLSYCMTGPGAGTAWSWSFSAPDAAFQPFDDLNVPGVVGTTLQVAQAFASSINAAAIARGCTTISAAATSGSSSCSSGDLLEITYEHVGAGPVPELMVGAAGSMPTCLVTTSLPACTFNPSILRLALPGLDCNHNGIDDVIDVEHGTSSDINANQVPDECESGSGTIFCTGDGIAPHSACPCANHSAVVDQSGCVNSLGAGGRLRSSGNASLAADTVVLQTSQISNSSCLLFQGTTRQNGGNGVAFGDGLRCAGGSVMRLRTSVAVSGSTYFPGVGDPNVSVAGLITTTGTRTYQSWYRNAAAFCTTSTFNLTNGVEITWTL